MTLAISTLTKILFSHAHQERLRIDDDPEQTLQFAEMRRLLEEWHYEVSGTTDTITSEQLAADVKILVIGAPQGKTSDKNRFTDAELSAIRQFVVNGGGLLLLCNQAMMPDPINGFQELGQFAGVKFQDYFNYSLNFLKDFVPHYLTNGIERVNVGDFAALALDAQKATPIARVDETEQTIMAASLIEQGRVVTIADVNWLSDRYLQNARSQNQKLLQNIITWLAARNTIDITDVKMAKTVEWGEATTVILTLHNHDQVARPLVECLLESDRDALIAQPERKSRTVPPGRTTRMQWTVRPQNLGDQEMRLTVTTETETLHYDDQLPPLLCLAPGYFTLELQDTEGNPKSAFQTGETFCVAGVFYWGFEREKTPLPEHKLELIVSEGIIKRGVQPGTGGITQWILQATAAGRQELTLYLDESSTQRHSAFIFVADSYRDRVTELYAAFVRPLEAEITERLAQLDPRLVTPSITEQPFELLSPDRFIEEVYTPDVALWLKGLLSAAHKEQWYNRNLLLLLLYYIAPTYLPNRGSFIPYAPDLANHLVEIDSGARRNLEYNLLASNQSDDIQIKQNIAAYLLHEKFGHGFFYTQTLAGQQLAILYRHGFPHISKDNDLCKYNDVTRLIEDSLLLANEGFATWLELQLLPRLDREVRQAARMRRIFLLEDATGMYRLEESSDFFGKFPSIYDSRYREVFEYLEFFDHKFNEYCALQLFCHATAIDFGIKEQGGAIDLPSDEEEMVRKITDHDSIEWRSSARLLKLVDLLHEHSNEIDKLHTKVQNRFCKADCRNNQCLVVDFVISYLKGKEIHHG